MTKTTVYLTEQEAKALRRLAASTGTSQSELIREGVRRVVGIPPKRKFHSMGKGASTDKRPARWTADEIYERNFRPL